MVYVKKNDSVKESYRSGDVVYTEYDGKYTEDAFPALGKLGWIMCGVDNKHSLEPQEVTVYWFYQELSDTQPYIE